MSNPRQTARLALGLIAILASAGAWAQVAPSLMAGVGGENGIKLGEGRLHPYFDLELRYDSAAGYFPPAANPNSLALGAEMLLHLRPGVVMSVPSDTVAFDLSGNVDYVFYTGLLTPGSQAASRLEAAANLGAAFNRKGAVEFDLQDQLTRSDRTQNAAIGVGVISFYNRATALLPIHPGGQALQVTPRISYGVEFFQPFSNLTGPNCTSVVCDPNKLAQMNYQDLQAGIEGRWKFLPKTAVVAEVMYNSQTYFDSASTNPAASILQGMAGLQGLLSAKIAVVLKAGWAFDFGASGANTVIGQAELNYVINEMSNVRVGYLRSIQPVSAYGTYGDDRGYVEGRLFYAGRLALHGAFSYDFLSFYDAVKGVPSGRNDQLLSLDLGPQYEVFPWLIASAGYVLTSRSSNQASVSATFTRNEGYLRATFTY